MQYKFGEIIPSIDFVENEQLGYVLIMTAPPRNEHRFHELQCMLPTGEIITLDSSRISEGDFKDIWEASAEQCGGDILTQYVGLAPQFDRLTNVYGMMDERGDERARRLHEVARQIKKADLSLWEDFNALFKVSAWWRAVILDADHPNVVKTEIVLSIISPNADKNRVGDRWTELKYGEWKAVPYPKEDPDGSLTQTYRWVRSFEGIIDWGDFIDSVS